MYTLSVHLFGQFSAHHHQGVVVGLDSRKAQELFSYLLLYRHQSHTREALASLLWGDTTTAQSKAYLRKTLWQLQSSLIPPPIAAQAHPLLIDHDRVQINPQAVLWLDVSFLECAFDAVQGVSGEQIDDATAATLRQAVTLYRGELLDGWYQDWCIYERERLLNIYLALLDKLMGYCETHQQYEQGLIYGAQILRHDRAHEQTHCRLMRLYALGGDRTAALRQFERCVAALDEELAVKPTPYTAALYQQIKASQLASQASLDSAFSALTTATPLNEILDNLKSLYQMVGSVQQHIQRNIQAVEQTLKHHR